MPAWLSDELLAFMLLLAACVPKSVERVTALRLSRAWEQGQGRPERQSLSLGADTVAAIAQALPALQVRRADGLWPCDLWVRVPGLAHLQGVPASRPRATQHTLSHTAPHQATLSPGLSPRLVAVNCKTPAT